MSERSHSSRSAPQLRPAPGTCSKFLHITWLQVLIFQLGRPRVVAEIVVLQNWLLCNALAAKR